MNSLLLLLILLVNMGQAFALLDIKKLLKNQCDLTKEDAAVLKATREVKNAKDRLPPQN